MRQEEGAALRSEVLSLEVREAEAEEARLRAAHARLALLEELRSLLRSWFQEQGSLRRLARAMHIDEKDYPRFVSALHKYNVHPAPSKRP